MEEKNNNNERNVKEKITFHKLIWYFLIFSFLGMIVEMLFGYITTGVVESRKGFLLLPLCPIYGFGACIFIYFLKDFEMKPLNLFISGMFIGTIFEYLSSYVLEVIYSVKFWDYSYSTFNLNSRVAIIFTIFWGILAVILMKYLKPEADKIIDKIEFKNKNIMNRVILLIIFIDIIFTIIGIGNLNNIAKKLYLQEISVSDVCETRLENTIFNTNKVMKTFPNLRLYHDSNEIFIKEIMLNNRRIENSNL